MKRFSANATGKGQPQIDANGTRMGEEECPRSTRIDAKKEWNEGGSTICPSLLLFPFFRVFSRVSRALFFPHPRFIRVLSAALLPLLFTSCALFRPKHKPEGPATALTQGDVTIEFAGVTAFPESDLRDALADPLETLQRSGVTSATGDDAAFFLELYYRRNGYADASASFDVLGPRHLRLRIAEGTLVRLGNINFTGNRAAPEETLRDYIIGQTRERFPRGKTDLPYVEQDVTKGLELVNRFYLAEGYLDAKVSPPAVSFAEGRSRADLAIAVAEGTRYTFGMVMIEGPLVFPAAEVRGVIADQIPQPYTRPRVDSMARRLEEFYKVRGYYQASVQTVSDPNYADAAGRVPTLFGVNPGPQFRFDGVVVRGTDRLKPQFLKNRFRKLTGKVYSPAALDEVYQRMLRTGLFNLLQVNAVPQADNTLRLEIDVKEAKAREVGFSLGYGTFEGPIAGFELRDRNFRGTGRPISLSVDYSTRSLLGELLYLDPYFLETDFELRARLGAQTRDLESYTKTEGSVLIEFTRPIGKQFRITAFALAKLDTITKLQVSPANAGTLDYGVSSLGVSAALDLRDNPVAPSRGLYVSASADVANAALGGDLDFVRSTFRATYLLPIGKNSTLAAGFRAGVVAPYGDTRTINGNDPRYNFRDNDPKTPSVSIPENVFPIDERFFIGGATSVRSFAERELGPMDVRFNNPIGGQAYTIFNLEYIFPIVGSLPDLRAAVFFDAGNLQPRARDIGFGDERYGIGAGVRYNLPIGPLRLDYGVNPNPKNGEAFGAFHFTFGFAF